jgi:hypothetical protein
MLVAKQRQISSALKTFGVGAPTTSGVDGGHGFHRRDTERTETHGGCHAAFTLNLFALEVSSLRGSLQRLLGPREAR